MQFVKIRRFQGLFVKAVIVLVLISLVPVFIIGYRVMKINSRLLQNQLLQRQQMQAGKLAATVHQAIFSKEQLLAEFADLHTDFAHHDLITQPDLSYLRARTAPLFYLAVFSTQGREIFDTGIRPAGGIEPVAQAMFASCLQGQRFVSNVLYEQGKPFVWLAEPLHRRVGQTQVTGVLAAALYLEEMLHEIAQSSPQDMGSMLVTGGQEILSYTGADLQAQLPAVVRQLAGAESGKVVLPGGSKMLVSSARVPELDWVVYTFQPASLVSRLWWDSILHSSLWDIVVVLLVMLVFVGGISYWVIIPITRPLERLRKAAVKLRENEGAVISQDEVEIPHNEIGELASVFVEMSQTLYHRRQELLHTQRELAAINQVLEHRIEERTRELQAATDELVKAERLAAIGQMASIISHEIRNPLAVISNAARLIKTLVHPTEQKLVKQFSIIEAEIRQANSIISEVLGYARTRDLILSTVDVNSYLRDLVLSCPVPPSVRIQYELQEPSVPIKIDAEEMKQALRNILVNALEAMPAGGVIIIGTKYGRRGVCISIRDTGTGITDEVRKQMFSPFFTTKARGTGLGLAVVRKAITRHKGKLFITSVLGQGTCFHIYLKIYRKLGDTNYGADR